ncbi:hypothetical protein [Kistimonas asteriae]|uniref:hypothetical protein n=1 Tax=Kistimonas asteriae TaxID=517724 RepID=UPI001BAB53F6|nr:hypothetical protein [Kistimonas asteriae]
MISFPDSGTAPDCYRKLIDFVEGAAKGECSGYLVPVSEGSALIGVRNSKKYDRSIKSAFHVQGIFHNKDKNKVVRQCLRSLLLAIFPSARPSIIHLLHERQNKVSLTARAALYDIGIALDKESAASVAEVSGLHKKVNDRLSSLHSIVQSVDTLLRKGWQGSEYGENLHDDIKHKAWDMQSVPLSQGLVELKGGVETLEHCRKILPLGGLWAGATSALKLFGSIKKKDEVSREEHEAFSGQLVCTLESVANSAESYKSTLTEVANALRRNQSQVTNVTALCGLVCPEVVFPEPDCSELMIQTHSGSETESEEGAGSVGSLSSGVLADVFSEEDIKQVLD